MWKNTLHECVEFIFKCKILVSNNIRPVYYNISVPGPITSPSESIYHSAQTVRLNKKLQNIGPAPVPCVYNNPACHQPQPCCSSGNMMSAAASGVVSDPIDEAVRLLEHSAAMLQ